MQLALDNNGAMIGNKGGSTHKESQAEPKYFDFRSISNECEFN